MLDAYQSAGIIPLDVTALNVDFAVGGSVKWLCGGPGNGWLYVRPGSRRSRLEPTFMGWQAHARPFALRAGARLRRRRGALSHRHAERAGALRRDCGLRPDRGDRRRPHPRELAPPDASSCRPADEAGFEVGSPRDPLAAAARSPCARRSSRPCTRSSPSGRSSATSGPTRACGSVRTTTTPTTSFVTRSSQIVEILETGAHERHLGGDGTFLGCGSPSVEPKIRMPKIEE